MDKKYAFSATPRASKRMAKSAQSSFISARIAATKYKISQRTIRRKLSTLRSTRIVSSDKQVVVLMDASYWGWKFGVVVFKDSRTSKILWRKFISKRETLADYQEGVDWWASASMAWSVMAFVGCSRCS